MYDARVWVFCVIFSSLFERVQGTAANGCFIWELWRFGVRNGVRHRLDGLMR
jgi:hypothetical protein